MNRLDIPSEDLADFHASIADVRVARGEKIYSANAPASFVFCIRSGFVKLVKDSSTCRKRIVRIVERDGVVGMEALFSSAFEHTAVAMGDAVACRVPAKMLRRLVAAVPSVQLRLLEHSHQALMEVERWLSEFAGGNARSRERMARLLLRLRDGGSNRAHRFRLEDISALLGIAVETASRHLAEMNRAGLLDKCEPGPSSHYYLADFAGLEKIAYGKTSAGRNADVAC